MVDEMLTAEELVGKGQGSEVLNQLCHKLLFTHTAKVISPQLLSTENKIKSACSKTRPT